jgi:excinuclease ABC subunit B
VAVLDADKEGFLRSGGSLIQTAGRAARNVFGQVIMYADKVTDSMRMASNETARRRALQAAYNEAHGITPTTIVKDIEGVLSSVYERDYGATPDLDGAATPERAAAQLADLEQQMKRAAADLDFEAAAAFRDRIAALKSRALGLAGRPPGPA